LWYYHQFLMLNLMETKTPPRITPDLPMEERGAYVRREIDDIKDLLEDYDDVKWIYEALMEYTLSLCHLEGRGLDDDEKAELRSWLGQLRKLDPMRKGRWSDVEREYELT
jgi:geranylgeranyl transferase type-2 subunit alpha